MDLGELVAVERGRGLLDVGRHPLLVLGAEPVDMHAGLGLGSRGVFALVRQQLLEALLRPAFEAVVRHAVERHAA